MIGTLKDFSYTRNGASIISFETRENVAEMFDDLTGKVVDIDIKKHHQKRSLDANAYAWVLIDKLATQLNLSKTEVYREAIRDIGGVSTIGCFRIAEAETEKRVWTSRGLGWQVDTLPAKTDGWIYLVKYYGSSEYDGAQMARLIDHLIQDCEAVGIPTLTEEQVDKMVAQWATKKNKEEEKN